MVDNDVTTTAVDRRIMLSLMGGVAGFGPIGAAQALTDDAELLALEAEIVDLRSRADRITVDRVRPHEQNFLDLVEADQLKNALKYSSASGRDAAIRETEALYRKADKAMRRMWSIPARTDAGRQAKVHILFLHCLGDDWREPDREADWDVEMTRALLCELAGTTAAALLGSHAFEGAQA